MRWVVGFLRLCAAIPLIVVLPAGAAPELTACSVCIVEYQTQGIGGANEEYIVVANNSDTVLDLASYSLRYRTSSGNLGGTIILSGNLVSYGSKTFVSSNLSTFRDANAASVKFSFGMADSGGTLQIIKSGQAEPVDQVGWGSAVLREDTASSVHERGESMVRSHLIDGSFIDTNNNASDFDALSHACKGLTINEIQPLLVTPDGKDFEQAIELLKDAGAVTDQDCPININGNIGDILAGDLGGVSGAGLVVIKHLVNSSDQVISIGLSMDAANTFQLVPRSSLGDINIPGVTITQPVLLAGQTYSRFSTGLKPTYKPTLGLANYLLTAPPVLVEEFVDDSGDSCSEIVINELLPNPSGEDSGQEWAEFISGADRAVSLEGCMLQINGTNYSFAVDQFIAPQQYLVLSDFSDGTSTRSLSLRNSGTNTVSFGRLDVATGVFMPLQTVQYQDAPEGQSWARFEDGWRWIVPNSGAENNFVAPIISPSEPVPTEFPAPVVGAVGQSSNPSESVVPPIALQITELLPNPAAPLTDDTSEFVEIHNISGGIVELDGYKLQTGSNYTYSFTIGEVSILPGHYAVFYSKDTNLVLSNSSGRARLLSPAGQAISETDSYNDAKDGETWAIVEGVWQWTVVPTPGDKNIASLPVLGLIKNTKIPKAPAPKKSTTKKVPTPKVAAAKTPKTPKASIIPERSVYQDPEMVPPALHPGILAGVGVVTLVYAAYEYRHDAFNAIKKFQRYREIRRATRPQSSGR